MRLDADGRSNLYRRRDSPSVYAFDVVAVDGADLRDRPLVARKRVLRRLMPRVPSRLLYVDHRAACAFDLLLFGLSVFAGPVYSPRPCSIAQATANAGISRSRKGLGP